MANNFQWIYFFTALFLQFCQQTRSADINVMSPQGKPRITLHALAAQFGMALPDSGVIGYVVRSNPITACSPLDTATPTSDFTDWWSSRILLAQQSSDCDFGDQIYRAQTAGYKAVIIFNNASDELIVMRSQTVPTNITIPSVFLGHMDGILLWEKYSSSSGYYVLMSPDQPRLGTALEMTLILLPVSVVIIPFLAAVILTTISGKCPLIWSVVRQTYRRKRMVTQLPERKLDEKKSNLPVQNNQCYICLETYRHGEKVRTIIPCGHEFHSACVDPWLLRDHLVCPVCRREIYQANKPTSSGGQPVVSPVPRPDRAPIFTVNIRQWIPRRFHFPRAAARPDAHQESTVSSTDVHNESPGFTRLRCILASAEFLYCFDMNAGEKLCAIMYAQNLALFDIFLCFLFVHVMPSDVSMPNFPASLTVIGADGTANYTIAPDSALLVNSVIPDEGISGYLIAARPINGCQHMLSPSSDALILRRAEILLVQRGGCNISEKVLNAADAGYIALIIFNEKPLGRRVGIVKQSSTTYKNSSAFIFNYTNAYSIPVVFVDFADGSLLWRTFQYSTGSQIVIASRINSTTAFSSVTVTVDRGSDIANVLLGFIPTVSYVCIIVFLLLIIVTRRFLHCSVFMCYKMATHNRKVVPQCQARALENSSTGSPETASRCPICLENFRRTEHIHTILPCQHVFHQHCIDHWLRSGKLACPLCRRRITLGRILHQVLWADKAAAAKSSVFTIPTSHISCPSTSINLSCGPTLHTSSDSPVRPS
ncbi:uncharacterized protein LOC129593928 [Paramacrobiotus metropolitanus]|uniref:uncharacterized protein LOC129593928 n=1 Tax=Paramacrobiotus metropolitanus TaxID=2943436 RepID=UPI002445C81B|nr:uncharacterized protein LOC129593928 [Paramacrobiotus metropolitanus]